MNAQLQAVAEQRRARELHLIKTERDRAARAMAMGVIGESGQPRSAAQTAGIQQRIDELNARAAKLAALSGDELLAEYPE